MASLLGAGVRVWLEPLAGFVKEGCFEVPLVCRETVGRLEGTGTLACWPSRARFVKKLAIDFCPDCEPEVDVLRVDGVLGTGAFGVLDGPAIAAGQWNYLHNNQTIIRKIFGKITSSGGSLRKRDV